ncbi:lysylphosphatidylglycerol synthase transmembrane domain-containing protein [Amantichitinum ursilacus]|uniref:Lysylphosphatidylglycerol synthase TM region n=1 Tax=Amantichitinum ursilacus TaxID=857265 RepID=A0A0N0XFU5_9NEIS|nr:lysylphosphatidylglycerol synthase transmembrane domain-containing protein [Amantichitinum ursilacus]KPC49381.1 hypothetical protein WG78_20840 [Amantichitinum ursilacus]
MTLPDYSGAETTTPPPKPRKSKLRPLIGAVIALAFVWLIGRNVNPGELLQAFATANPMDVLAALVLFGIGYALRIARWQTMLKPARPEISWWRCAGPFMASFAANNVLPLRAGDVLRAFGFNQRLGVSPGGVLATLFVERLLDLLLLLVMLGVALALFGLEAASFAGVGAGFLLGVALAILILLVFPQAFAPLARAVVAMIGRFAPRIAARLRAEVDLGLRTLAQLAKGGTMLRLLALSLGAWLCEGCVYWFAALALADLSHPAAAWLALPVGTLATLIPSTPGYVGTFDYFARHAMTTLGNAATPATAFALLVHLLLWLPPTLMGGLYLIIRPVAKARPASSGKTS